jgi:hypothetical protein
MLRARCPHFKILSRKRESASGGKSLPQFSGRVGRLLFHYSMCTRVARYAAGIRKVTSSHDEAIALFRIGNRADDRIGGESATVFGDELIKSVK